MNLGVVATIFGVAIGVNIIRGFSTDTKNMSINSLGILKKKIVHINNKTLVFN